MKEYRKPILEEEKVEVEDVIATSAISGLFPGDNESDRIWK